MEWEFKVLDFIQNNLNCGFLDWFMPKISGLVDFGALWIFTAIVFLCFKKYRKDGILLLVSLILGFLIGNIFLKNVIVRDRPCWINTTVQLLVKNPIDYSFPSGHALSSFIGATGVTFINKKFAWVAFPIAILIAFSRLYLYVHFPTDVIGGMVLGVVISITVNLIVRKIYLKRKRAHYKVNNFVDKNY